MLSRREFINRIITAAIAGAVKPFAGLTFRGGVIAGPGAAIGAPIMLSGCEFVVRKKHALAYKTLLESVAQAEGRQVVVNFVNLERDDERPEGR